MFKIIDNFLDDNKFNHISDVVKSFDFHWHLGGRLNDNSSDDDWQGIHNIISEGKVVSPTYKFMVDDIVKSLQKNYKKSVNIYRVRVNLFGKDKENRGLGYHADITEVHDYLTLLLYLEDSNGKTEFKDVQIFDNMKMKTVDSFANRALIFPSICIHQTMTQTDVRFRTNINMNFKFDND